MFIALTYLSEALRYWLQQEQKKNYRSEKKRATNELLSTLQDPTVIVLSDWLKVRGTLKSWTKLWCVLKPGLLVLYKSNKVVVVIVQLIHLFILIFCYFSR